MSKISPTSLFAWAKKEGAHVHPCVTAIVSPTDGICLVAENPPVELNQGEPNVDAIRLPPHLLLCPYTCWKQAGMSELSHIYSIVFPDPTHLHELSWVEWPDRSFVVQRLESEGRLKEGIADAPSSYPILEEWDESLALALAIMYIRSHPSSFWYTYVSLLPQNVSTPLFFLPTGSGVSAGPVSVRIQHLLMYTSIYSTTTELLDNLHLAHTSVVLPLCTLFPNSFGASVDFADFLWAYMMVESRAFKFRGSSLFTSPEKSETKNEAITEDDDNDESPLVTVMVPLVDLANHTPTSPALVSAHLTPKSLHVKFTEYPPPNPKLLIRYNTLPNDTLLLSYGFAISDNPDDQIPVTLEDPEDDESGDPETQLRKSLLLHAAPESAGLSTLHSLTREDPLPESLIRSLRLLLALSSEIEGMTIVNVEERIGGTLSQRNEDEVKGTVSKLVEALEGQFSTTLEEDWEALEDLEAEMREDGKEESEWENVEKETYRYTLEYLISQKEILERAKAKLEVSQPSFSY
ncbi:hypothetical protein BJ742DRAFT_810868 [Cladochytrium replicatum]|nr:hypothetical protein BJ742DRAFT_810868 [Cladochytrium replicatum]